LLTTIITRLDAATATAKSALPAEKKAEAIARAYRAFKATGKVDEVQIVEAIALRLKSPSFQMNSPLHSIRTTGVRT
jgi:hypothetical protein